MAQLRINVPEGCTAVIKKEDGFLILTFEQKEKEERWEPKDGDVCVSDQGSIFIFDGNGYYNTSIHAGVLKSGKVVFGGALNLNNTEGYRYATESEKQRLFDAIAKAGKRWNAEKKCIEDLPRWRSENNEEYYYYVATTAEVMKDTEKGHVSDDARYGVGNYFKTREAAEKVATQIREIFKNSKAE